MKEPEGLQISEKQTTATIDTNSKSGKIIQKPTKSKKKPKKKVKKVQSNPLAKPKKI